MDLRSLPVSFLVACKRHRLWTPKKESKQRRQVPGPKVLQTHLSIPRNWHPPTPRDIKPERLDGAPVPAEPEPGAPGSREQERAPAGLLSAISKAHYLASRVRLTKLAASMIPSSTGWVQSSVNFRTCFFFLPPFAMSFF